MDTTTTTDLQRRCAELAGWSELRVRAELGCLPGRLWGNPPTGFIYDKSVPQPLPVPDYPRDLNAAWGLVEICRGKDWLYQVNVYEDHVLVWVFSADEAEARGACTDTSVARAICLAFVEVMSDD